MSEIQDTLIPRARLEIAQVKLQAFVHSLIHWVSARISISSISIISSIAFRVNFLISSSSSSRTACFSPPVFPLFFSEAFDVVVGQVLNACMYVVIWVNIHTDTLRHTNNVTSYWSLKSRALGSGAKPCFSLSNAPYLDAVAKSRMKKKKIEKILANIFLANIFVLILFLVPLSPVKACLLQPLPLRP